MSDTSSSSLAIVGGGIVGLCIAVVAQARGHSVTLITRDRPENTASGVAAGMIAPVLESRSDPWNDEGLARMRRAQRAWLDLLDVWPEGVRRALRTQRAQARSIFISPGEMDEDDDIFFSAAMKEARPGESEQTSLRSLGIADSYFGQPVVGDWLIDARRTLTELAKSFIDKGGRFIENDVYDVGEHTVRLTGHDALKADHVVLACGFDSVAFSAVLPVLARLHPIKGHLLDMSGPTLQGVVRSSQGYLAGYGDSAKFGASMEAGKADLETDPAVVAELETRATTMFPDIDLSRATPRTGIRAATPDGWPLIGRDAASGVLVATGMRRNGYVFAPLAAQIIVDLIEGADNPDAHIYRLDRF